MAAEDRWGEILFDASFAGFPIHVLSTSDDMGRALARHTYPHRNGAAIEDMGAEPHIARCRLKFFGPDHDEAFRVFHDLAHSVEPEVFTHPLYGSYSAKVGEFHAEAHAEQRDCIMVDCTFEEDTLEPAVFEVGAGSPTLAGAEDVQASADEWLVIVEPEDGTIIDVDGVELGNDAVATSEAWSTDASKTLRDVTHEMAALSARIDDTQERLHTASDISQYPAMIALTKLRGSLVKAAAAFSQRSPRIFKVTVAVSAPLLVVAAQIYQSANEAGERAKQLIELNDIRNPARIEAGTELRCQSPAAPRSRLRSPL